MTTNEGTPVSCEVGAAIVGAIADWVGAAVVSVVGTLISCEVGAAIVGAIADWVGAAVVSGANPSTAA
jgi:hypothetical protein